MLVMKKSETNVCKKKNQPTKSSCKYFDLFSDCKIKRLKDQTWKR